jgi:hypothetical protein
MRKRVSIATIFGLICGVVCVMLATSNAPLPWAIKLQILSSRTLIGFAIGISILKMKWWLHGPLMGLIFSLPMAFSGMMAVDYSPIWMVSATIIMGIIYGFIIELFTTVVFKAKE